MTGDLTTGQLLASRPSSQYSGEREREYLLNHSRVDPILQEDGNPSRGSCLSLQGVHTQEAGIKPGRAVDADFTGLKPEPLLQGKIRRPRQLKANAQRSEAAVNAIWLSSLLASQMSGDCLLQCQLRRGRCHCNNGLGLSLRLRDKCLQRRRTRSREGLVIQTTTSESVLHVSLEPA